MDSDVGRQTHQALMTRLLEGPGEAPPSWRRQAFDNTGLEQEGARTLVAMVATGPSELTDATFTEASEAGLTQDQLWELVICAAVGQSVRQYDGARDALAAVIGGTQP